MLPTAEKRGDGPTGARILISPRKARHERERTRNVRQAKMCTSMHMYVHLYFYLDVFANLWGKRDVVIAIAYVCCMFAVPDFSTCNYT